ncbi:MAG TPA: energy transducer TonB [Aquaticitalea sp.]|nr:energy transducer TonB [Aquaticitalea sp.]
MKNLNKIINNNAPKNKKNEISQKKDVDIQKNSTLYFQIGLILCLLATYGLFEMKFKTDLPKIFSEEPFKDPNPFYLNDIIIIPDSDPPKPERKAKQVVMVTDKAPIEKPDIFVEKNPVVIETPESNPPTVVTNSNPTETQPVLTAPVVPTKWNMKDVEKVPIFPGCESASNNGERMACMSEKLARLIQNKFNTDLASDLGLTGVQRIYVEFTIDGNGHVTNIKSRSPYTQLENEAERIVGKIPTMQPGMQRNTPVSVVYNLPIVFQVH